MFLFQVKQMDIFLRQVSIDILTAVIYKSKEKKKTRLVKTDDKFHMRFLLKYILYASIVTVKRNSKCNTE